MGIVGEFWDKVTGKNKPKEETMTRQEKGEQTLMAAMVREGNQQAKAAQERANARGRVIEERESAGRQANVLKQAPRPAEKMVSYKDLFTDPARQALKDERGEQIVKRQEIARGTREPIKSYNELHPPDSKGPNR